MISLPVALNHYKQVAAVLALLLAPLTVGATENLARGKPYLCTTELMPGWTGLVDGQHDSDQPPACFGTDNAAQFPKEVLIDLGNIFQITNIAVYNSLNGNTRHIATWSSLNATDFDKLREYYFPADKLQPLIHSFPARRARYVKITMYDTWTGGRTGDNCLYLREVEVYGTSDSSGGTADTSTDAMALARWQQPLVKPYATRLFRRYCLEAKSSITVGVLGDSFASPDRGGNSTWIDLFVGCLKQRGQYQKVEVIALTGEAGLNNLADLRTELTRFKSVDLLIVAYGRRAALQETPPVQFRRQLRELVQSVQRQVAAFTVIVTPPPLGRQAGLERYEEVKDKDTLAISQAAGQVASLTGCGLVRTASVLAHSDKDMSDLYKDNVSLSQQGHLALSRALEELLW